ncbi:MAG TPA: phosphonate ABC transporter ATP-binding protein [Chloroflexus aurantiacus]|uniref:Phosphonate ABC transporter, ATPase subunit n=1 Tax=Chloroflexus aurantiacus (strain ATCC 29366 / DSM 635 / J-10-fl) TaxID=324602 RepID=A9WG34_CHLAA|nr:phosphonate ABC transporter ATP-binding protein [Chloroflexus aurantiacus]ABY36188.1 phosphonate ABC transporter, ATPase subunit [Chloroflexus aurantiacus J-10-fl]HBW66414.1 phosphonate ABC transporter ATP-binding protein [Chloroflexus aurantiacus]
MPLLEADAVTKRYGTETLALNEITFAVQPGEFVAIIGPSGAGKSTLLRCINRLIDITSGDIRFDGVSVPKLRGQALRHHRTQIGMIFQHYNLVNRLSVLENVLHGRLGYKNTIQGILGLYSEQEKREAVRILEMLGLEEQMYKRCDQLSGGQKQRVGIARALVQQPRMLLCDEPIASLDPSSAKIIMDTLREINRTLGITVLVNLHQVDVALHYAERIIGINRGKILYDGVPQALSNAQIYQIYGSEAGELILDLKERYAA